MRIIVSLFLLIGAGILALATIIRMEDKYPAGEPVAASCHGAPRPVSELGRQANILLQQTLEADKGVGIAAAVVTDGELIWSGVAGKADGRTDAPLTEASRLRIGSVSKPITAALTAKLVESGQLDLDAPITRYLPDFPSHGNAITMRMLAAHLSGIRQYDFADFDEANNRLQFSSLKEGLAFFKDDPLVAPPGTEFHYTSFGYNLIGAIIESIEGKPFGAVLEERLAAPLGLESLTVDDPKTFVECRGRFHTVYFGAIPLTTIWRNHSEAYPSAGILISAGDLATLAHEMFDGVYFDDQSKALFRDPIAKSDGAITSRSLGWRTVKDEAGSIVYYSHGGLTNGAIAEIQYYPEDKTAIAVIANYNLWLTDRYSKVTDLAVEQLPGLFGVNQ